MNKWYESKKLRNNTKTISSNQIRIISEIIGRSESKRKNSFHIQLFAQLVPVTIYNTGHYSYEYGKSIRVYVKNLFKN